MANIVITTAAAIITITVPAGAMVSVTNNGQTVPISETAEFAPVEVEGQPVDQIRVVVEITAGDTGEVAPTPTVDPSLKLPTTSPSVTSTPTSTTSVPTQNTFNGFALPQPPMSDFSALPQPLNMANGTANPSPSPSPSPSPTPFQETTTTTTQVNARTNQPVSRTVTTVQQGVAPTPTPAPTRVPTPNTSTTRGFGSTQQQQQASSASQLAQPRTTIAPVGAIPSASAAQTVR